MTDPTCDRARRELALGDDAVSAETRGHLSDCAPCRAEGRSLDVVRLRLRATAEIEPSERLDRSIRNLLGDTVDARPFPRPLVAGGLAAAGLLALVTGLAGVLAQNGAAERGVPLALGLVAVYLAVSSAAALPLLFSPRLRAVLRDEEAGT